MARQAIPFFVTLALLFGLPLQAAPKVGELKIYRSFDRDEDIEVALLAYGDPAKRQHLLRLTRQSQQDAAEVTLCRAESTRRQTRFVVAGLRRTLLIDEGRRTLYKGTLHHFSWLYLGKKKVRVIYDKAASRRGDKKALLAAYLRVQRLDSQDRATIERAIKKAVAGVRQACANSAFSAKVGWRALERRGVLPLAQASVNYLEPLAALCKADRDYRQRIRKLKVARFDLAKTEDRHALRVSAKRFSVGLAPKQPNTRLLAAKWLKENL